MQKQSEAESQCRHDAFISYSRKNTAFADCLEKTLTNFTVPKGLKAQQRHLNIFRDKQDFTGNEYHRSLEKHLTESAKLLVICSPEASQSEYVNDEIRQFARLKGVSGIIPILFAGIPNNEARPGQEAERAFPLALCDLMAMPLAADFRGFIPKQNKINGGAYRDAWYTTLANIYDVPRAEIEERDRKRRKRARRIASGVIAIVLCLIGTAVFAAWRSRQHAQEKARDARQLQYIGNIGLAQQAYDATDLSGMRSLLQAAAPAAATPADDLRGFEWYYLWKLSQGPSDGIATNDAAVNAVAFSPDGKLFATGGDDGIVKLWSADSRKVLGQLDKQEGAVSTLAFSPDGKMLATGGGNTHVKLWDVSSRSLTAEIKELGNSIYGVVFSGPTPILAAVSYENGNKMVRAWDISAGRVTAVITGAGTADASDMFLAFSPDGSMVALSSGFGVAVCHFPSGDKVAEFDATGKASAIAFSSDGKTLAIGSDDGKLMFIDLVALHSSGTLDAHDDYVSGVAFSPDGRFLVTASRDKTIKVWDAVSHAPRFTWKGHTEAVEAIAITRDGRTVASASGDKTVRLWDVSAHPEYEELNDLDIFVTSIARSPRDNRLALASASRVVVWDPSARKPVAKLNDHGEIIADVAFSSDQKTIAIASSGKDVELWNTISGKVEALQGHTAQVYGVAFSPDGSVLASGSGDNTVRLWNVARRQALPISLSGHGKAVTAVAFSPGGKTLATGSNDHTVRLWDAASGHQLASVLAIPASFSPVAPRSSMNGGTEQPLVTAVSFSPNGEVLASSGADGTVTLWRVDQRGLSKLGALVGHTGVVTDVVFSPDGRTIATSSEDTTVKLWHATMLRELVTLKETKGINTDPPMFIRGSENQVGAVGFSLDGKFLATGLVDGTVRIRRAATSSEVIARDQKQRTGVE
jgi:WD40 repeat protein